MVGSNQWRSTFVNVRFNLCGVGMRKNRCADSRRAATEKWVFVYGRGLLALDESKRWQWEMGEMMCRSMVNKGKFCGRIFTVCVGLRPLAGSFLLVGYPGYLSLCSFDPGLIAFTPPG